MNKILTMIVAIALMSVGGAIAQVSATKSGKNPVVLNWYSQAASLSKSQELIVKTFNDQNPDIRINVVELPEAANDKLQALVIALRGGDSTIDFFNADVTWTATFAAAGLIEPVDKYFPVKERELHLPGSIQAATYNGQIWGFPFRTDAGVLYYRTDLLAKYKKPVPATYDELFGTAKEINAKEGGGLYALVGSYANGEGLTCNAVEWFYSNGGQVVDAKGNVVIDSPNNVQILALIAAAYKDKLIPEGALSYGAVDARTAMYQGKQVFLRAWPKEYAMGQDPKNSVVVGKLGVAPLPRGPQGSQGVSVVGGWQLFLNKNSKHKDESIRFMKFYASAYAQKEHALKDTYLPTLQSLYTDADILKAYPFYTSFSDVLKHAVPRPQSPFYSEISGILSSEVQNAIKGNKSASKALADAQKAMKMVGQ